MLPARSNRLPLTLRLAATAFCIYAFFWVSGWPRTYDDDELPPSLQQHKYDSVPDDKLAVSIKTSAPDAYTKLSPLLLLNDERYKDNVLLMGDLAMDIGAWHVHDVLAKYDPNFVVATGDLERYRKQVKYAVNSVDLTTLKEWDPLEEDKVMAKMDRYKILRMLEIAWELLPDRNWYAFVDDETYIVRPNLHAWLGQFDHEEPIFFGNPPLPELPNPVSYGGSSFILSRQAMETLLEDREKLVAKWQPRVAEFPTALDLITEMVVSELDLLPNITFPGLSGFAPGTAPFGPSLWCQPVLLMHSVPIDQANAVWRLERDRQDQQNNEPLLFVDLWNHFMQPENLNEPRDDWDNLSSGAPYGRWNILFEGVQYDPHRHIHRDDQGRAMKGEDSWEACQQSCSTNEHCVQWSYSAVPTSNWNENGDTRCHLSSTIRFGVHAEPQEIEAGGDKLVRMWKSGWKKDKFEGWARQQRCKNQQNK